MEKQDIINVLDFVKYNRLLTMEVKVESLRNDIDRLEDKKTKAAGEYFRLKRMIGEAEQTLAQKRKEMTHMELRDYTSSSGKDS